MIKSLGNILSVMILMLFVGISSCSTDRQIEESLFPQEEQIENFNTITNRQAVLTIFDNKKEQELLIEQFENNRTLLSDIQRSQEENLESSLNSYANCSECGSYYSEFLIPMFEELIQTDNNDLISKIESYESLIDDYSTNENIKENLRFMLFTFKEATHYRINNEDSTDARTSIGTSIGRGIVGGFLAGCAAGGYTGAVTGTVTVPIIGTVVGAVSGCIAAGAVGSVYGAVAGAFWGWADS